MYRRSIYYYFFLNSASCKEKFKCSDGQTDTSTPEKDANVTNTGPTEGQGRDTTEALSKEKAKCSDGQADTSTPEKDANVPDTREEGMRILELYGRDQVVDQIETEETLTPDRDLAKLQNE